MTEINDLHSAEAAFSNAESALRQLADRSEQPTSVTEKLSQTRAEIVKLRERFRQDIVPHDVQPPESTHHLGAGDGTLDLRAATDALLQTASTFNQRSVEEFSLLCDTAEVLDEAYRDLGTAERTLADAHADIRQLILAQGDIARELKLSAAALTALKPEGLTIRLDEITWEIGDASSQLKETVEALTAGQTEVLTAQLERLAEAQAAGTLALRRRLVLLLLIGVLTLGAALGFGAAQLLG